MPYDWPAMPLFELGTDGKASIPVGLDGSATSARAGWYAAGLARRQRARVTAVYVARTAGLAAAGSAAAEVEAARREADEQIACDIRRGAEELSRELGVPLTFIAARAANLAPQLPYFE